jgi:PTH1 family peptidyl-tRNA hydrolase
MLLLVGLGNPGSGYAKNRHNVGFMALDLIGRALEASAWKAKFQGQIAEARLGDDKVILLKPETFMNLSGQSVGEAARFYKIDPQDVIVFHDELDVQGGKMRIKIGGGHGGHNGLRSIDAAIGQNYKRVRIGIGHPGDKELVHGHVLGDFSTVEYKWLDPLLEAMASQIKLLLSGKDALYMSKVAAKLAPPKVKDDKPKQDKDQNQDKAKPVKETKDGV